MSSISDLLSSVTDSINIPDLLKEDLFSLEKPQNLDEYFHIGRFLLAKKIGYILLFLALIGSIWCLIQLGIPFIKLRSKRDGNGAKECYYDSPRLKNYTGHARVFSKHNEALYDGAISNGMANGLGTLNDKNGVLLYRGPFKDNCFHGDGIIYYQNGQVKYTGAFVQNLFEGNGTLSFDTGQVAYVGKFSAGKKNGRGTLYDETGTEIYTGMFYNDNPNLSVHLNVPASKLKDIFLGSKIVYNCENKIFINYPDMNCIIIADKTSTSLGKTKKIFIMPPSYYPGTNATSNRINLTTILNGENFANGFTKLTSSELCVIDTMRNNGMNAFKNYEAVSKEEILDDVFNITTPSSPEEIYTCKYKINNFIYTFYFTALDGPYVFYSIERVG